MLSRAQGLNTSYILLHRRFVVGAREKFDKSQSTRNLIPRSIGLDTDEHGHRPGGGWLNYNHPCTCAIAPKEEARMSLFLIFLVAGEAGALVSA